MEHNLTTFVAISKLMFGVALSEIKGDENQMKLLTSIYNNWLKNSTCPVYMVEVGQSICKVALIIISNRVYPRLLGNRKAIHKSISTKNIQ